MSDVEPATSRYARLTPAIRRLGLVCGLFLVGLAALILVQVTRGAVEPDTTATRTAGYVIGAFFGVLGLAFLLRCRFGHADPVVIDADGIRATYGSRDVRIRWSDIAAARVEVLKVRGNVAAPMLSARPGRVWLEFALTDPGGAEAHQPLLKRLRLTGGTRDGFTHYVRLSPENIGATVARPSDPTAYVPGLTAELTRHIGPRFRGCVLKLTATTYTS